MFPEQYVRRFAIGLAFIGLITPIALLMLGYEIFALLSLYACVPFLFAPVISRFLYSKANIINVKILPQLDKRLLGTIYLGCITIVAPLANNSPRPLVFFGLLSLATTISILYCLQHQAWAAPLAMTGVVVVIFHASTTLTNAMWLGSGDGPIIWVGVKNIVQLNDIVPSAGYDIHPLFFVQAAIISMFGISTKAATFGFGMIIALTAYLFIFLLSRWSGLFSRGYDALPALITPLLYNFHLTATYSIPSTTVPLLSILPIGLLVAELFGTKEIDHSWRIILLISVVSLALMHRFEYIWVFLSATLVLCIVIIFKRFLPLELAFPLKFSIRQQTVPHFILGIGFIVYIYSFSHDTLVTLIVDRVANIFYETTAPSPAALTEPFELLVTFIDSSLILVVCIVTVFIILRHPTPKLLVISGITILFGTVYFPSPIHLLDLEIFRISRYSTPFIALFTGFGILALWDRSTAVRIVLLLLVVTTGVLAFANDAYTRDNPIVTTGTFTNYLTEQDRHAAEYSFTYDNEIAYERTINQYHRGRTHAVGWGEVHSGSVEPTTEKELCSVAVLTNSGERERRGQEVYGTLIVTEDKDYAQRDKLYTNENNNLYGPCI
jgi:hypothetical protein